MLPPMGVTVWTPRGKQLFSQGRKQQLTRAPNVLQAYQQGLATAPVPTDRLPQGSTEAPCSRCGRQQGHGGSVCCCAYPDLSPPGWSGPLMVDGQQAAATFCEEVLRRKPHSRHQEGLAAGIVTARKQQGPRASFSARAAEVQQQVDFTAALANMVSHSQQQAPDTAAAAGGVSAAQQAAAAAAQVTSLWSRVSEDEEEDDDEEELATPSFPARAAQPKGFQVIDLATHFAAQQPRPTPTLPTLNGQQLIAELEAAGKAGEPNRQLHALVQAMQLLVAKTQQLDSAQQLSNQRYITLQLEQLLSTQFTRQGVGGGPVPTAQSLSAEQSGTHPAAQPAGPAARRTPALETIQEADEESQLGQVGELSDAEAEELCQLAEEPPLAAAAAAQQSKEADTLVLTGPKAELEARRLLAEMLSVRHILDRPRHESAEKGMRLRRQDGTLCNPLVPRVDSGCAVEVISKAAAKKAGIRWLYAPGIAQITLANGSTAKVLGITERFQVVLREGTPGQRTTWCVALVLDSEEGDDSHDLLLSKKWLADHHIVLDSASSRLRYKADLGRLTYLQLLGRLPDTSAASLQVVSLCLHGCSAEPTLSSAVAQAPANPAAGRVSSDSSSSGGLQGRTAVCSSHLRPGTASLGSTRVSPQRLSLPAASRCPGAHSPRGSSTRCQQPIRLLVHTSEERAAMLAEQRRARLAAAAVSATQPSEVVPNTSSATESSRVKQSGYYPGEFNPLTDLNPLGSTPASLDPAAVTDPKYGWHYGSQLSAEQQQQLLAMLERNLGAFAFTPQQLVGYHGSDHDFPGVEIHLQPGVERVYEEERRYGPRHLAIQDAKCSELLECGWIEEISTTNPFAANSMDADGIPSASFLAGQVLLRNWTDDRFCQDYRPLNSRSEADNYKAPTPDELFRSLGHPMFLTKCDMRSGFHQLFLHPDSRSKTAFWWRRRLYQWLRMPFGLRNATAAFQCVMDTELQKAGLTHCAKVFVDDVIIFPDTFEQHLQHVEAVLQCFLRCGLRVHPKKSSFRC